MITEESGLLVVAVSGGIDSVVLLDTLVAQGASLIVAHVNHGIRDDSDADELWVRQLADNYGVPFVSIRLELGSGVNEETARHARYAWLETVQEQAGAVAVATAHHEDDILETICINLSRGTGWRGLCSLRETKTRKRPLLNWSKADIVTYALEHGLQWREDSTNESLRYFRNRVRHAVIPRFTAPQRRALRSLYDSQRQLRIHIETENTRLSDMFCKDTQLLRYPLIMSSDSVAIELLRTWLGAPLEQARLRDLLLFAKTARSGAKWSLDGNRFVTATARRLIVLTPRG